MLIRERGCLIERERVLNGERGCLLERGDAY